VESAESVRKKEKP